MQQKMTTTKQNVRICEDHNVVHQDADPLTKEERQPLHYSTKELAQIKSEIYLAIDKSQRQQGKGGRRYHFRGLEPLVDGSYEDSMERKKDYAREVVEHYRDLLHDNVMEETSTSLSQFAASKSKADRKESLKKAMQDEIEASKVYKESSIS